MKNKQKLFALTLLMCGTIASVWADGVDTNYIINEDFEDMGSGWNLPYNNWTLYGGKAAEIANTGIKTLKIEDWKGNIGYAITPRMNFAGNVLLSFSQGRNATEHPDITITIQGGGVFDDNKSNTISYSIPNSALDGLQTVPYKIIGVQSSSKINFSQKKVNEKLYSIYLDDVKIIKLGDLTLNETIDSSEPIEANVGTECAVQTNRTLTGGIWNTMCLPFNVTKSQLESVLGANQDIQLRTYMGYADKVMTFKPATEVAAGTPFLIKLNTTVVNPAFTNVTIVNTPAQSVTYDGVSFVGTYGPVDLQTDGSEMFITKSKNTLSVPAATSNRMYGMRAFIRVTGSSGPARIVVGDDETTDLSTAIMAEEQDKKVYDLNGQQVMHPKRGLYIVNNKITFLK
jgi:hypothetical protein